MSQLLHWSCSLQLSFFFCLLHFLFYQYRDNLAGVVRLAINPLVRPFRVTRAFNTSMVVAVAFSARSWKVNGAVVTEILEADATALACNVCTVWEVSLENGEWDFVKTVSEWLREWVAATSWRSSSCPFVRACISLSWRGSSDICTFTHDYCVCGWLDFIHLYWTPFNRHNYDYTPAEKYLLVMLHTAA